MGMIKEWQEALNIEINHLKKYGSTKYQLTNGHLVSNQHSFTYFFETSTQVTIPVGSKVSIVLERVKLDGRMLSSEGNSVLISTEKSIGDLLDDALLFYDPWELLEELIHRLDDVKKSKKKKKRIKQLVKPTMPTKHPLEKNETNSHELFFRSQFNPVTFVWGPPGTGKTYTLARVAANKYFQGKKVLILSHSNQAVDVLLRELVVFLTKKSRFTEGDVLRYGSGSKLALPQPVTTDRLLENHQQKLAKEKEALIEEKHLLKLDLARSFSKRDSESLLIIEKKLALLLEKIRQKELQFLKEAKIIGTTLAKAATDEAIFEKDYDLVIIDEASMAYVPQAAFAASLGNRVIVSGDFKQLPPIATSRHALVDRWLKEDIFHCAGVVDALENSDLHPHLMLLKEQRRMHPHISSFTNKFIYGGKVFDHPRMAEKRNDLVAQAPFPKVASVLVDTSASGCHCIREKSSKSRLNLWHLFISFQLIHEAFVSGAKSIGYVTPYRAQALLMEKMLQSLYEKERMNADITAATVHRFQGSERDVIIFDTVDSYPEERPGMLLIGKDSERLVNVAITRTKGKFIHVSDRSFIKAKIFSRKTVRQLVDHQEQQQQVVTQQQIGTWIKHQHRNFMWMHALKTEHVFQDIAEAKKSIILSLPEHTATLSNEWLQALESKSERVSLTIVSKEPIPSLNSSTTYIDQTFAFPFLVIDQRYLWLGQPLEAMKNSRPPFVAVRLDSKDFTAHFLKTLGV